MATETTSMSISDLAGEVSRLAHSGLPSAQFYTHFLDTLPTPPGTLGTVAWVCGEDSFSKIAAGSNSPMESVQLPVSAQEHAEQLNETRLARRTKIFDPPPNKDFQVFVENALPTIVVFPILVGESVPTVVEAYLPPDVPEAVIKRFVGYSELLCGIASNYHAAAPEAKSGGSLGLSPAVHKSLRVKDTCYSIANEGRRAVGCDRVTVLTKKGEKYKVRAVSGQESVNPRANVVQYLQRLVNLTMRTGEPFWYPDSANQLPPEIERELEAFIEISLAKRMGILPLQVKQQDSEESDTPPIGEHVTGALVVEQFTESLAKDSFQARTMRVVEEGSVALRNATDHEHIFLLPIWRAIGDLGRFFRGSALLKTIAVLSGLVVAGLLLAFFPAELKISSEGRLMPEVRRNLYAQAAGRIETLHVEHGSKVTAGQLVASMFSPDQNLAMEQAIGEIRRLEAERASIRNIRLTSDAATTKPEELRSAAVKEGELEIQIDGLKEEIKILESRKSELEVQSTIDGEIITFNLKDKLQDKPVEKGQSLMQVADLDGGWIIELNVPDRRITDVLRARQDHSEPLEVEFRLASDTSLSFEGRVRNVAMATRVDQEQGQNVLVTIEVDEDSIPPEALHPFTGVQAKIKCGKRPLGVVWFRDVWHFIKSNIWFRLM